MNEAAMTLSTAVTTEIDHWLTKFPADQKRSAVVAGLLKAQAENQGWLSEPVMQAVADYLGLPQIEVYEVATFYDMFELKPIGRHKIGLCTNISCQLRGSDAIVSTLQARLGVGLGETTADGQFTLRETECLGACATAPVCQVNDHHFYENLTPESMTALLDQLSEGEAND